jgi:hypothetical protein
MSIFQRSLLLVLTFAGTCSTCLAQEAAPTFTVLITAKQSTVQSGSELSVSALLTNISGHPIVVLMDGGRAAELEGYLIEVRDSQGRIQRTSRYYWSIGRIGGSKLRAPKGSDQDYSDNQYEALRPGSFGYINPYPGKTNESWFDVNKLYAPLAPGKYTIQVQRTDEESKTVVKSNVITVTIIK